MSTNLQSCIFSSKKAKAQVNILVFLIIVATFTAVFLWKLGDYKAEAHQSAGISLAYEQTLGEVLDNKLTMFQENTLMPVAGQIEKEEKTTKVFAVISGYSSTEDQTDSTPFLTASGSWVKDGVIATNFLPFGTKIKIPAIYGDKIFVVEDRMHPKHYYNIDIWFPDRWEALNFGIKRTYIEIIES